MIETEQKYARVEDNFGTSDRGKEQFIGKVARVLAVENDYQCFSQVQLEFMDGQKEWFCNTTLEEIDVAVYNQGD